MNSTPWEQLVPNDTVRIIQSTWLDRLAWQTLLYLYLPIIGNDAYGLYHALYQTIDAGSFQSPILRHADLMNTLIWSKEQYVKARRRLEGIGLVKNYRHGEQFQDPQSILLLEAPVSADTFFNDTILYSLLYQAVGKERIQALRKHFETPIDSIDGDGWQDATAHFKDVYRTPDTMPSDNGAHALIRRQPAAHPLSSEANDFDTETFRSLLSAGYLGEGALTEELVQTARDLHQLYDYDEVDLARLAYAVADMKSGTVSVTALREAALKQAVAHPKATVNQRSAEKLAQEEAAAQRTKATLTQAQQALANQARQYAVIPFAKYLKQSKNGYLRGDEAKALSAMAERALIPPAVINIMVYYYLIEEERSTLSKGTLEWTEDNWAQHGIQTPEAALAYLKARQNQRRQPRRTKQPLHEEKVPDWLNENKAAEKQTPVADQSAAIRQLLNEMGQEHES